MDKKVKWTEQSFKEIDSICEYISKDSKYYAYSFADKVFAKGESLSTFYERGRIVPEILNENIREIFVFDYRLIYKINQDSVEILTVIHGKRLAKNRLRKFKS